MSVLLLLRNLPLLVGCFPLFSTDNRYEISVSILLLLRNLPLLVGCFALFSTDNRYEISVSILLLLRNLPLLVQNQSDHYPISEDWLIK